MASWIRGWPCYFIMLDQIKHRGLQFLFDQDNLAFYFIPQGPDSLSAVKADILKNKTPLIEPANAKAGPKNLVATINLENYSGCNLACSYCFAARTHLHPGRMSFKTAKKAIDLFFDHYKKRFIDVKELYIDFTGTGEPLLNFKLIEQVANYVLTHKKRKRIYLRFTSNCTLFNRKVIRKIKDLYRKCHRILRFSLSYDGPPIINDRIRHDKQGKGSSYAVRECLANLRRENAIKLLDNVNVTYTFDSPFLVPRLEYLYHSGFKEVIMKPYRGMDKRYKITRSRLAKVKKEYHDLTDILLGAIIYKDNYDYLFAILNPGDLFGRYLLRVFKHSGQMRRCEAGHLSFFVDHKGTIFLCPSFGGSKETALGSVHKGFKPGYLEKAGEKNGFLEKCGKCWAKKLCGGECLFETYQRGSLKPDPLLCELKQFLIKEAAYFFAVLYMKKTGAVKAIEKYLDEKKHIFFE